MNLESDALAELRRATRQREELRKTWDGTRNSDLLALLNLTIPKLFRCERFGLFLLSPDRESLMLVTGTGVVERGIRVAEAASMVGQAVRNRSPVICNDLATQDGVHREISRDIGYEVHNALTVPVLSPRDGRAVGAVQVLNKTGHESWHAEESVLLGDVAFSISGTVLMMHESQNLLQVLDRLDRDIQVLDREESAIRGGHMLRTFEPAEQIQSGGFLHGRYNGTMYPPFIDAKATEDLARSWDCGENDIFICTHQKVGTHLAKKYAVEILRRGLLVRADSIYSSGDIGHGTVPWPEVMVSQHGRAHLDAHIARTHDQPRLWYVHCSYEDLPIRRIHPRARFIIVYRDPKAVAVSQYFFWKKHPLLRFPDSLDLDRFVEMFVEGDLYFGDYHHHVLSWLHRRDSRIDRQQILALRYEDLVERKLESAQAMSRFILPGNTFDNSELTEIASSTDFEKMKSDITRNPQSFHLNPKVYFRAGKTNDWEAHLSDLSVAAINEKSQRVWDGGVETPRGSNLTQTLVDLLD